MVVRNNAFAGASCFVENTLTLTRPAPLWGVKSIMKTVAAPHGSLPTHFTVHRLHPYLAASVSASACRHTCKATSRTNHITGRPLETRREVLDLCLIKDGLAIYGKIQTQAQHEGLYTMLAVGDVQRLGEWGGPRWQGGARCGVQL
jgi:hypothetical protein